MALSGLVGNGMLPAVQSSANQRRIMAAVDALHPFALQSSFGTAVLGPPICFRAQRSSHWASNRTGGSRYMSSPSTVASEAVVSISGMGLSLQHPRQGLTTNVTLYRL